MLETEKYPIFDERHNLANFGKVSVSIRGRDFLQVAPTCEHLYQMTKFYPADSEIRQSIRNAPTPKAAKAKAKENSIHIREDWDDIQEHVMAGVIRLKIRQNSDIQQELLGTGDMKIFEDADQYASPNPDQREIESMRKWGIYQGEGENLIGEILMSLRAELRIFGQV